jgi:hypothetical protein
VAERFGADLIAAEDLVVEWLAAQLAAALQVRPPRTPPPPRELFAALLARVAEVVERDRAAREVRTWVGAVADDLDRHNGGTVSAAWVADGLRHIAVHGCPGPAARGKTCVHEVVPR